MTIKTPWTDDFYARKDLGKYSDNSLLLFAVDLKFNIEDIDTLATESLTDGSDDKKCDLVYVDTEAGHIVIAQGYLNKEANRASAPSNKASDLNTAASWLLGRPVSDLPKRLQAAAEGVRAALETKSIRSIYLWYVHNLPESKNVEDELKTVETTARSIIKMHFSESSCEEVYAIEVGQNTLQEWHDARFTSILVKNEFVLEVPGGYPINGRNWQAYVTAVPAYWLYGIYRTQKVKLFSANVRDYLGSRRSDSNINQGIKDTAVNEPENFWVFNNGLTALVENFEIKQDQDGKKTTLIITGLSIVNGAQTTGAVGSLEKIPELDAMVPARFVKCKDQDTIRKIIRFNNSQNKVTASDFRSNDVVQRRLREEFTRIPDVTYLGGRRGGDEDLIRRPGNLLPSETAAQALAALHQNPVTAYNEKSNLWLSDRLYSTYFSEKTHAVHIVFSYALLRCVEAKKLELVQANSTENGLSQSEKEQLEFLRYRGAPFLLTAAIGNCLEIFLGRPIPNMYQLSFGEQISPPNAILLWFPIVEATIPFCSHLSDAVLKGLRNTTEAERVLKIFRSLVEATKSANTQIFSNFAIHILS